MPLSVGSADTLERAIEAGCMTQPFVEEVKVRIDRSKLKRKRGQFDYTSLTGEMLDVFLVVNYKGTRVEAEMKFLKEMNYPLMFIKKVEKD